jgi:hypothetical protein
MPEFAKKENFRLDGRGDRPADDAASLAGGDKRDGRCEGSVRLLGECPGQSEVG